MKKIIASFKALPTILKFQSVELEVKEKNGFYYFNSQESGLRSYMNARSTLEDTPRLRVILKFFGIIK